MPVRSYALDLVITKDRLALGSFASQKAAELLRQAISEKNEARLIVATGSSQFEVLEGLVMMPDIDWSKVDAFHLDEYIGLSQEHPASFCGYLKKRFVDRVPLRSFYYLDGIREPKEVIIAASEAVAKAPIDVAMIGIGENAHLAFNDPPADFQMESPYHIVQLDDACRRQQVGEGWFDRLEQVPTKAVSMSIRQIMATRHLICSVPDRRKATAVAASLEGPITPDVPGSILQQHPNVTIVLDEGSAGELSAETSATAKRLN
jgi:glucosamine-6-phosphate deaminase